MSYNKLKTTISISILSTKSITNKLYKKASKMSLFKIKKKFVNFLKSDTYSSKINLASSHSQLKLKTSPV